MTGLKGDNSTFIEFELRSAEGDMLNWNYNPYTLAEEFELREITVTLSWLQALPASSSFGLDL